MNVEIYLENDGHVPKGFNWQELKGGIERNIDSFLSATNGEIASVTHTRPPDTAQGIDQIIHWVLHVAENPEMAKVYYRVAIFAWNEVITAAKNKQKEQGDDKGILLRLKILGREIQMPASVSVIEEFLKSVFE